MREPKIFTEYCDELIKLIKKGAIGILPTDTIYGLVCRAHSKDSVQRVYEVKKRTPDKPLIILISSQSDLSKFKIEVNASKEEILSKYWPGKVSIILPCPHKEFFYLHRGTNTLALRLPDKLDLKDLLEKTGPLVAPSANPEGLPPAKNITEAENYFKEKVDFYLDQGDLESEPSTLISINHKDKINVLREGAVKII